MDITALAKMHVERVLGEGDLAIDATVGNGHDTVFLARCVGRDGTVLGFDVQESAIVAARNRLAREEALAERVTLVRGSHADLKRVLGALGETRRPKAIMFNLGYLPGGNKSVTTRTDETISALRVAAELLAPGGLLTVVLYPGHPEGKREAEAVVEWGGSLPKQFAVLSSRLLNRAESAPFLLVIERN